MKAALLIHIVTQTGVAPIAQTFLGIDVHATPDLLRQFRRVVFRHTLQYALHQNTAGIVADVFPGGDDPDAVLFQLGLVDGTVIAVPGKAVKLVNKDTFKRVLVTVGNHPLKLGPAVCGTALCAVDVLSNHDVPIVLGKLMASLKLSLDGLLRLAVTGVAGIDNDIHGNTAFHGSDLIIASGILSAN